MSETPYYSPAWTTDQAEKEFYLRMLFMFDGLGFPCWLKATTWLEATQERLAYMRTTE